MVHIISGSNLIVVYLWLLYIYSIVQTGTHNFAFSFHFILALRGFSVLSCDPFGASFSPFGKSLVDEILGHPPVRPLLLLSTNLGNSVAWNGFKRTLQRYSKTIKFHMGWFMDGHRIGFTRFPNQGSPGCLPQRASPCSPGTTWAANELGPESGWFTPWQWRT